MADANVVKQIDAPMPFEAIACHKRIALSCSSGCGFDHGLANPNHVAFEILNSIPSSATRFTTTLSRYSKRPKCAIACRRSFGQRKFR